MRLWLLAGWQLQRFYLFRIHLFKHCGSNEGFDMFATKSKLSSSSVSSLLLWLIFPVISGCTSSPAQPTITTAPIFPPASQTSRVDSAVACLLLWSSYRSASISTYDSLRLEATWVTLPTYVETYYNIETVNYDNITSTTLCDGRRREVSSQPTTTLPTSYSTYYNYSTWYLSSTLTNRAPRCTYARNDPACSRLWTSWSASTSSLVALTDSPDSSTRFSAETALSAIREYAIPPCDQPQWKCPVKPDLKECTVGADRTGTMYYWPVSTVSGDFCADNGTTVTPRPTIPGRPNTIVLGGETFTSPSVYLVYPSVTAYYESSRLGRNTRYGYCGATLTDITLTMARESVFSVEFRYPDTPLPINWDNFNTVRREAWAEACPYFLGCTGWALGLIRNYEPFIQIPHEIIDEDRRDWHNCTGWGFIQPKLIRLEPPVTATAGYSHWYSYAGTAASPAPTGTGSHGLPTSTADPFS